MMGSYAIDAATALQWDLINRVATAEELEPIALELAGELAEATQLPLDQVETLLSLERVPRSLEEPPGGQAATGRTAAELLVDPVGEDEYERVVDRIGASDVRSLTRLLDERERQVLFEHYGLDRPPQTLRQIGSHFGLSAERVRQIEKHALDGLREALLARDTGSRPERARRP